LVLIRARSVVNLRKTSLLSVDKGLKNTATPFTMEDEDLIPFEYPVQDSAADEKSQSGSYASTAETAETEECVKQSVEQIERHPFSEPWEDSDLVLTVEDDTFYVHRQILSLHSPVFKAMLSSKFKEGTATEIPLPGKKANEVLDFLKVLYLKETEGITLDKMGHLLKLADEYDVQGVLDLCTKCLKDVPKSEENVVKILYLATDTVIASEDSRLDGVRDDCEILIKDMDLVNISAKSDFKKLSRDSMERVFVKRTERLETFIREIHPQLVGLVEYCLYLKLASSPSVITRCPQHFPSNKSYIGLLQRIRSCLVCRGMITQLVTSSVTPDQVQTTTTGLFGAQQFGRAFSDNQRGAVKEHVYGGNCHFDEKLVSLLQDINKVVSLPDVFFGPSTTSGF
ncbi:unnamed protein product, partial [Porites evermanni]